MNYSILSNKYNRLSIDVNHLTKDKLEYIQTYAKSNNLELSTKISLETGFAQLFFKDYLKNFGLSVKSIYNNFSKTKFQSNKACLACFNTININNNYKYTFKTKVNSYKIMKLDLKQFETNLNDNNLNKCKDKETNIIYSSTKNNILNNELINSNYLNKDNEVSNNNVLKSKLSKEKEENKTGSNESKYSKTNKNKNLDNVNKNNDTNKEINKFKIEEPVLIWSNNNNNNNKDTNINYHSSNYDKTNKINEMIKDVKLSRISILNTIPQLKENTSICVENVTSNNNNNNNNNKNENSNYSNEDINSCKPIENNPKNMNKQPLKKNIYSSIDNIQAINKDNSNTKQNIHYKLNNIQTSCLNKLTIDKTYLFNNKQINKVDNKKVFTEDILEGKLNIINMKLKELNC